MNILLMLSLFFIGSCTVLDKGSAPMKRELYKEINSNGLHKSIESHRRYTPVRVVKYNQMLGKNEILLRSESVMLLEDGEYSLENFVEALR